MPNIGRQTAREKLIEELYTERYGRQVKIKDIMKTMYIDEHKTQKEIANTLHVSVGTVNAWMNKHGVQSRKITWI
jgi:DNA-binding transcriptional regulator YiaG